MPALLWGTSAALASVACIVGPEHRPPVATTTPGWQRLPGDAAPWLTGEPAGDLRRWWLRFHDPTLSALVDEALAANPDLQGAIARVSEARARVAVANAGLWPRLDATGDGSARPVTDATEGASMSSTFRAGLDASWEVDLFGGIRRSVQAVQADAASVAASLDDVRATLLAEVALDYVQVRTLRRRIEVAHANLATQEETLQLTMWRAEAGIVSDVEVELARANREQTRATLATLEGSLAEAEHRLDILLGVPPGTLHGRLLQPAEPLELPPQIAVGIPADTLRQRPDVRAAERALAAATARVGAAQAARFPSLRLSGSIGMEVLGRAAIGEGVSAVYALLGSITAPLFSAGRLEAEVHVKDALWVQAEASWRETMLRALQDVENALVALVQNRERLDALGQGADAARMATQLARHRASAGLVDFQAVLESERSLLAFEDSLAAAHGDGLVALIRLYKALGGGWEPSTSSVEPDARGGS